MDVVQDLVVLVEFDGIGKTLTGEFLVFLFVLVGHLVEFHARAPQTLGPKHLGLLAVFVGQLLLGGGVGLNGLLDLLGSGGGSAGFGSLLTLSLVSKIVHGSLISGSLSGIGSGLLGIDGISGINHGVWTRGERLGHDVPGTRVILLRLLHILQLG